MFSWLFSNPLPIGSEAPLFELPDQDGGIVSLSALRGHNVALIWYPGDDTSVCTRQLCEFKDNWNAAKAKNIVVYGVNPQNPKSHAKFKSKYSLPFPLLVDEGQRVGKLYQTNGLIVKRTVYLIGPDGVIRYARRGKPAVDEVLNAAG